MVLRGPSNMAELHGDGHDSLWGGEQMTSVGGQAVDGAVVSLDFTQWRHGVAVPKAQQAPPAAAEQHRGARDHPQNTDPVWLSADRLEGHGSSF